jgi:DNA-binding CsgD family transcriptional regulator
MLDDDALTARTMAAAAILRFEAADPGAEHLAREGYRFAVRAKDSAALREATTTVGHLLTWSGDSEGARDWLTDQLASWRDRDEMMQADCLWYLALVEFRAGRWDVAAERAAQMSEIRTQYGVETPSDHMPPALIALHRGEFDLARRHSERAIALAGRMHVPAHLAVLATIELWDGTPARAISWFEQAEAAADAREFEQPAMRFWRAEYGEALLRAGRIDEAEQLVKDWTPLVARAGPGRDLAGAIRVAGLTAMARGELAAAVRLLEDAARRHDAAGDPFGHARARLASGVANRRLRRKRLARTALEAAEEGFDALGASSWTAETRTELARLGGRTRIEGMSPSERRVAELVAQGRTNRDIAAALFLTERTVASHLTHAYAKLGVRSRTELAHLMSQDERNLPTS